MKITAPARMGPMRLRALLMAEASPELPTGTDVMSAVVRGATSMAMPKANSRLAGSTSIQ